MGKGLINILLLKERGAFRNVDTSGAWLSSARVTAGDKPEEGEDDVKSSCPLCSGRHTCYNGWDKGSRSREGELTPKTHPWWVSYDFQRCQT
ncbi:hypothetical protein PHJA_000463600 [Phtheirospermum japonicum]|uniref:Uncharacterized protein n=1 Tax=Phtheirospermum japonicum TaxID=374723 RepID=A0A830BAX9_9LAMI|nr:hypothetical protein PHJA_000463600 [Phtheirospermum japonicum]